MEKPTKNDECECREYEKGLCWRCHGLTQDAYKHGWKAALNEAIKRCPGSCGAGCLKIIRSLVDV